MANPLDVLIVDDERNIRTTLRACLEGLGCGVGEASSAEAARAALGHKRYDLAFLDVRLGRDDGLALVPELLTLQPQLEIVVVTAYATIETAVTAIQRGARDYLPKPFTPAQIAHLVARVASRRALENKVATLEVELAEHTPAVDLDTASPLMAQLYDTLAKAAAHDVPVLFEGENGTGKSVLARHLHRLSPRAALPFVVVNCPTLSEELLASELFGHVKGAFTGAVRDQAGRVEAAAGGTLFLDEIGELPPSLQAKLLRFLQDHEFERLGESRTRHADVRVVAATNRDLEAEVKTGRFREDLYYRLNTVELVVPPLRQRREDLPALVRHLLANLARGLKRAAPALDPATEAALYAYAWPGNVRELRNVLERALILSPAPTLGPEALPARVRPRGAPAAYVGGDFTLDDIEREHLERVVARAATMEEAARILGIESSTLWRKRKRYEEEKQK